MLTASGKSSRSRIPGWLADPFCCLAKADNHHMTCLIQAERNQGAMSTTKLVRTDDGEEATWSAGRIHATRRERKVELIVNLNTHQSVTLPPFTLQEAVYAADALRAASSNAPAANCNGRSIQELLWEELDAIMERLMTDTQAADGRDPGRAEGVAYCIAVFQNPYLPNIDKVREQAMERWEAEHGE